VAKMRTPFGLEVMTCCSHPKLKTGLPLIGSDHCTKPDAGEGFTCPAIALSQPKGEGGSPPETKNVGEGFIPSRGRASASAKAVADR